MDIPAEIWDMIVEYRTELYFHEMQQQLKQRFLYDRLTKEIFYNRFHIYYKFVDKEPLIYKDFMTKGEINLYHFGYGDDRYMEDYFLRFENLS